MRREQVEDEIAVLLSAARLNLVPQDDLLAVVVHPRLESEPAALPWIRDRPARKRARDLLHVLLRVAAFDAERVQLHQLARVVLVEAGAPVLRARREVGERALLSI